MKATFEVLAEASRRVGVSTAAPYRHFADRDELLAAVAVRGLHLFATMATSEAGNDMGPVSWKEYKDPETGVSELRKVAKAAADW